MLFIRGNPAAEFGREADVLKIKLHDSDVPEDKFSLRLIDSEDYDWGGTHVRYWRTGQDVLCTNVFEVLDENRSAIIRCPSMTRGLRVISRFEKTDEGEDGDEYVILFAPILTPEENMARMHYLETMVNTQIQAK